MTTLVSGKENSSKLNNSTRNDTISTGSGATRGRIIVPVSKIIHRTGKKEAAIPFINRSKSTGLHHYRQYKATNTAPTTVKQSNGYNVKVSSRIVPVNRMIEDLKALIPSQKL